MLTDFYDVEGGDQEGGQDCAGGAGSEEDREGSLLCSGSGSGSGSL